MQVEGSACVLDQVLHFQLEFQHKAAHINFAEPQWILTGHGQAKWHSKPSVEALTIQFPENDTKKREWKAEVQMAHLEKALITRSYNYLKKEQANTVPETNI